MADAHAIGIPVPRRMASTEPASLVVGRDPAEIYRDLAPAVRGYLRAQGSSDPDDLLGDVFVAVVKDLARFDGDGAAVRRWVFTIAHHRVVDERRRRRRRPQVSTGDVTHLDAAEPSGTHDDVPAPADPRLIAALGSLTPDQRDVVGLRIVADLSVADVARILRKRPDAVKALQHRALTRLGEILGAG